MVNNRMLAVAAVLAMAVPALGAAAPIVAPPAYEQLVEGHTVFTVIEVFNNTTTIRAEFAAAVAVLVREYDARQVNARFPGVLWFNDQYLVNPRDREAEANQFRYPCGGAVMAVNAGADDPRVILANAGSSGETRDVVTRYTPVTGSTGVDYGDNSNPDYTGRPGPDPTPADDTDDPTFAWANVTTDGPTPTANSDTVLTSAVDPDQVGRFALGSRWGDRLPDLFDYRESYLITDPNDHVWIIDKYVQYSRVGTSTITPGGVTTTVVYSSTVWVVNILGSPVFIPDDGIASCGPYNDLMSYLYNSYAPPAASGFSDETQQVDDAVGQAWDPTIGSRLPYRDTPPMGYAEPSQNGYCYNGTPAPCDPVSPDQPVRLYNALLYFKLADLTVDGGPRDHSLVTDPTDTNGCEVGTEWVCPGDDDNREGNSHPFHPTPGATTTTPGGRNPRNPNNWPGDYTPDAVDDANVLMPHDDVQPCPQVFQTDPSDPAYTNLNHGGSTPGYYPYCSNIHATKNVDIYFSPAGRPFAPLFRVWGVQDTAGSTAPFHGDDVHPHTT